MPDFLCLLREPQFSPGRVEDDASILASVASVLRERDYVVELVCAAGARWPTVRRDTVVLTMAQGALALRRLRDWEAAGVRVINSVRAVRNCQRVATQRCLTLHRIPQPATRIVAVEETAAVPEEWITGGVWIKRGDFHATRGGDVVLARSPREAEGALQDLKARGVRFAVLQRHVSGRVVKFYGVGRQFFVSLPDNLPVSLQRKVADVARRAAAALELEVFGGDCVVTPEGECLLIDLNDWPSYAPCRPAAAAAIAAYAQAEKSRDRRERRVRRV